MAEETRDTEMKNAPASAGASDLGDEASRMAGDLRDEAESRADRWTRDFGKRGSGLARALGEASTTLRDEGDDQMADLAGRAAEQVERMAGYLEKEDPRGLMDDLEQLGRSNPAAFLGTAFAAGVLSGRLFRASSPEKGNGSDPRASSATTGSPTNGAHVDRSGDR